MQHVAMLACNAVCDIGWGVSVRVVLCAGRAKLKGYAGEAIAALDAVAALDPARCRVVDVVA